MNTNDFDYEAADLCGNNHDPSMVRFARKCIDYGRRVPSPAPLSVEQGEEKPAFVPTPHEPVEGVTLRQHVRKAYAYPRMIDVDGVFSDAAITEWGSIGKHIGEDHSEWAVANTDHKFIYIVTLTRHAAQVRASRSQPVEPTEHIGDATELVAAPPVQAEKAVEAAYTLGCRCARCLEVFALINTVPLTLQAMIACEACGNKRCPHATAHWLICTNSNADGQPGSDYGPSPAASLVKSVDSPPSAAPSERVAKIQPWTFETAPELTMRVRTKRSGNAKVATFRPTLVTGYGDFGIEFRCSYKEFSERYEQLDGSPCGVASEGVRNV